MEDSGLNCFRSQDLGFGLALSHFRERCLQTLATNRSLDNFGNGPERAAAVAGLDFVVKCSNNFRNRFYDMIQAYQNSIPYTKNWQLLLVTRSHHSFYAMFFSLLVWLVITGFSRSNTSL